MSKNTFFLFRLFVLLICVFQVYGQISDQLPQGWVRAGSKPDEYQMGVDSAIFHGTAAVGSSGFIKSLSGVNYSEFGTLMQRFTPKEFKGNRVQLSCFIKYENILGNAGLWMRVDTPKEQTLDNMLDRPIKGTDNWTEFTNVLDVPKDAERIAFGILLKGDGHAWLDDCKFEIVDKSVPLTPHLTASAPEKQLDHPINLSF
ncbi:unnamed protein product [Rhizophagus irregularis]|uniref:Transcriptional regulator n=1 Tax=Rhizophagus irregularis TaxID=588596 RepID=A0A2N1N9Q6_9GLOM|nr:hypothetical protein RhiirC2_849815 [Rhizophagus irregularis]CAB4396223.1 unnamed protein product [Rhizophagus irregularis]CAB5359998.1 unnamed protein product [Rhizophagus irregularis]